MPVHLYGQACEMDAIMKIADDHNLFVVEDNAQAHGATYNGKKTGSFGHINATSFYPTKNLGALGEAGAITTDDAELAKKIKTLRNYGSQKRYYNEMIGYNNRIDEFEAAFLSIALKHLDKWNKERAKIADWYYKELNNFSEIKLPVTASGASTVNHLFVIRTVKRDELRTFLTSNKVITHIHYPIPPHLQRCYKKLGYNNGSFPIAETLARSLVSLPLWVGLKQEYIKIICNKIKRFLYDVNLIFLFQDLPKVEQVLYTQCWFNTQIYQVGSVKNLTFIQKIIYLKREIPYLKKISLTVQPNIF